MNFDSELKRPGEDEANFLADREKTVLSKEALDEIVKDTEEYKAVDAKDRSEFKEQVEGIPWATKSTTVDKEDEGEYQKWDALKKVTEKKETEVLKILEELQAEGGREKFLKKISKMEKISGAKEELKIRKRVLEAYDSGRSQE